MTSCYLIVVTTVAFSTSAGITWGASLYLTEKSGYVKASEQQVTLTNAPGHETVSLTAFSSHDGPAGTKVTAVEEGCCLFYDSSPFTGIQEDVIDVNIPCLSHYELVLERKDGF